MAVLREYHRRSGALIDKFEGTVERFAGDGLLVLFNDPLPCPEPSARAVQMAVEMRDEVAKLAAKWRTHGHDLGFGIGIAHGYATLGLHRLRGTISSIRRLERWQISLPGSATGRCNGQILVDAKVHTEIRSVGGNGSGGRARPQGFPRPVKAFNVRRLRTASAEPA